MMNRKLAWGISLAVVALFAVFFLSPAWMVVKQAFQATGADGETIWTLDFIGSVFSNPIYREGLWNALMMGVVSTLLTLLIAFPLALVAHRYDFVGKKLLGILVLAPMILPPFVGAVGIKQMLGVNGAFNALLIDLGMMNAATPFDWLAEGRFLGIVVMNALHLYPILYMNIAAALANSIRRWNRRRRTSGARRGNAFSGSPCRWRCRGFSRVARWFSSGHSRSWACRWCSITRGSRQCRFSMGSRGWRRIRYLTRLLRFC